MVDILITEQLGDLFAYNLNINFQTKKTFIEFGEYISENSKPCKILIFNNVIWQEFSEFDFCNIFNSIEIEYDFKKFYEINSKYFEKMKNYISAEKMEEIMSENNIFYSFLQTSGFNCFVITKEKLKIQTIEI